MSAALYAAGERPSEIPMNPQFNIWFEIDGEVAASRWRMELLAAVDERGSITAARDHGVDVRIAW